jgi:hypothetical protein
MNVTGPPRESTIESSAETRRHCRQHESAMFKRTLLAILVILVVLIGGLCVAVALQPDTYRIERSATMAA